MNITCNLIILLKVSLTEKKKKKKKKKKEIIFQIDVEKGYDLNDESTVAWNLEEPIRTRIPFVNKLIVIGKYILRYESSTLILCKELSSLALSLLCESVRHR